MKEVRQPTHRAGLFGYNKPIPFFRKKKMPMKEEMLPLLVQMSVIDKPSFVLLAEALPQIIWTANPDGYQDYFNRQWFDYTGLTEEKTYSGQSALHPDDFPRYVSEWSRALEEGGDYEAEYRFRRFDGEYRWHLVRGLPVIDSKGKTVKWFGTFTDIHERKVQEESMRNMKDELELEVQRRTAQMEILIQRNHIHLERLKSIIEAMPFAAMACDEKNIVLHKNNHFRGLFHIHQNTPTLIGRSFRECVQEMKPMLLREDRDARTILMHAEEKTPAYDTEIHLKNNKILSADYIPIFENDRYWGHLMLFRDVTASKRSDAIKTEFVSLASHQLRTPLTIIRWALNLLAREHNLEQDPMMERASQAADTMATIISTLLSITRLQSGAIHVSPTKVSLLSILDAAKEQTVSENEKRIIRLHCPDDLELRTDQALLREALYILMSNAVSYSPDDSEVEVYARRIGDEMCIYIKDNGFGIPMVEQPRIFEKFFRASNVLEKVPQGTGLGLYLCNQIIQVLEGKLSFTSEEGKGTTFMIHLPVPKQS